MGVEGFVLFLHFATCGRSIAEDSESFSVLVFLFCIGCTESSVKGFVLVLRFAMCFPFWFPECLGCSFCCCVLIPLYILLDGRLVVLKFWIQVFASHFIT